jgi:outer membrane immunogenic protein
MKKLLLSSVALFGLTATAMAADLPRRTVVAPAPFVAVPVFTWTGFYVGVNAGAAFSDNRDNTCIDSFGFGFGDCFGGSGLAVQTNAGLAPVVPLTGFNALGGFGLNERRDDVVFAGGGQIGYNFQFTPGSGWVVGIEADIQGLANDRRDDDDLFALSAFGGFGGFNGIFTAAPVAPIAPGSGIDNPTGVGNGALGNVALFSQGPLGRGLATRPLDWFATVRGRLGYAWDRLFIYATGGVAFTDRDNGDDFGNFGGFGIPSGGSLVGTGFYINPAAALAGNLVVPTNTFLLTDTSDNNVGWTVGGGVEWAFATNWTAKIEGLYVAFERERNNNNGFVGGEVVGVSNTGAAVTAGQLGFDNRRDRDDFGVVRVGVNYKFGTF